MEPVNQVLLIGGGGGHFLGIKLAAYDYFIPRGLAGFVEGPPRGYAFGKVLRGSLPGNVRYDYAIISEVFGRAPLGVCLALLEGLLPHVKKNIYILLAKDGQNLARIPDFRGFDISYIESLDLVKVYPPHGQTPSGSSLVPDFPSVQRPLRLLFALPHQMLTGGVKMLIEQMRGLQKKGHFIRLASSGGGAALPKWVEGFAPDEAILLGEGQTFLDMSGDVDIIIAGFITQLPDLNNPKTPLFYWEQGYSELYGDYEDLAIEKSNRPWLKKLYQTDCYLASDSGFVQELLQTKYARPSVVLPVSVDTSIYFPPKTWQRNELPVILLVGHPTVAYKRFGMALEVLRLAWSQGLRFKVAWAGQTLATLEDEPFELKYHCNVSQSRLAGIYRESDIYLTCCHYEGCPVPPLEAMASGTVVVSTDSGGINEYATHGENALISKKNTVSDMALLLKMVLTNQALYEMLRQNGLLTVKGYDLTVATDKLESILYGIFQDFVKKEGPGHDATPG
ncbi:MAG: glycosyltransferase family 4 protein [Turicibacter sp.]|nr:glycosyltransferase family 4 protein [Turicibacter sp.]